MKLYQIRRDEAQAFGYFVYESDSAFVSWRPIQHRFTLWGARRVVRRMQTRRPSVETYTDDGKVSPA